MGTENVYKIAASYSKVRGFLEGKGWEYKGKDKEVEMDSFKNKSTGKIVFVEDISEDFQVTFLMGRLDFHEFGEMARRLTPKIELIEVESSWEGKPSTIVVAMTEDQIESMWGGRPRMRRIPAQNVSSRA